MCSIVSFFIAHSAPSLLSFHSIPVFSLLVPTTKSRHHFSFFYTLSFQVLRNFLSCTPLTFPVVSGFFDSFPSFLLVCVIVSFTRLLLLIFPLLHWHTGFSNRISLSPSSPYFFILSHSRFHSHSSPSLLCNLAFLCPLLAPLSNIFLALSLPLLVPFIPRYLPRTSIYSQSCSQTSSFSS
jgi:hypothetical protein